MRQRAGPQWFPLLLPSERLLAGQLQTPNPQHLTHVYYQQAIPLVLRRNRPQAALGTIEKNKESVIFLLAYEEASTTPPTEIVTITSVPDTSSSRFQLPMAQGQRWYPQQRSIHARDYTKEENPQPANRPMETRDEPDGAQHPKSSCASGAAYIDLTRPPFVMMLTMLRSTAQTTKLEYYSIRYRSLRITAYHGSERNQRPHEHMGACGGMP